MKRIVIDIGKTLLVFLYSIFFFIMFFRIVSSSVFFSASGFWTMGGLYLILGFVAFFIFGEIVRGEKITTYWKIVGNALALLILIPMSFWAIIFYFFVLLFWQVILLPLLLLGGIVFVLWTLKKARKP